MNAQSYTHPHRVYHQEKRKKKTYQMLSYGIVVRPPAQPRGFAPSRHTIIPPRHVTNRPLWQDKSYDVAIKTKFTQVYKSKTWTQRLVSWFVFI